MFFGKKSRIIRSAAFDCGSSAVRAALFSYPRKDIFTKPDVSEIIRFPFASAAYMDARRLKQKTWEGIRQIIKKIPSSFQPQEIILGFSSPFYISKTIRATNKRQNPQLIITQEESHDLMANARHTFEDDSKKRIINGDIITFTALPLKTYINGYQVENLDGMAGKVIEASFYFEATTREVFDGAKELFMHQYPKADFRVSSTALANFWALRDLFGNDTGFVIIDIGGEVTEITLAMEGVLERVVSFPMGHMAILRETAALFGISITDASFIISRYAEHTLEIGKEAKIKPLIMEFQDAWRKKLFTVLTAFTEQYDVPPHILFTGDGVFPFHKDIFSEEAFGSIFYAKNKLMEFASSEILDRQFNKHSFRGTPDFGLASLTLLGARTIV